jgi:signal-transduction protein with cAMP-binding, CBS, and nucleotidyltransferase domain
MQREVEKTMVTVRQLLDKKGSDIWWIAPKETAFRALEMMAEKNIGALLVMDEGKLKGIFSERDYARKVILKGKSSRETTVDELMTPELCCIESNRSVEECMALMSEMDVRHLPVFEKDKLIGMVSIRDVVNALLSKLNITISELTDYICGKGYGTMY